MEKEKSEIAQVSKQDNLSTKFQLRPLKPAKVSEISEATASSPIAPAERVNFHIGNPVEDDRLISFYQNLVVDSPKPSSELHSFDLQSLLEDGVWDANQTDRLELLCRAVKSCIPYMPRGGFHRNSPSILAELFIEWLTQHQQEPLGYDLGKNSGRKEVIYASGGIIETLRVIFQTLSDYLISQPGRVLTWQADLPSHLAEFKGLELSALPSGEGKALQVIESEFRKNNQSPIILLLGNTPSENFRRRLRHISCRFALFFIEANDTPNHSSLAREAGLLNSVLRVLSPSAIDPRFSGISLTFIIGNADFLKAIETVHFELKGTPSAAEAELLTYLLQNKFNGTLFLEEDKDSPHSKINHDPLYSVPYLFLSRLAANSGILDRASHIFESHGDLNERLIAPLQKHADKINRKLLKIPRIPPIHSDPFLAKDPAEILDDLIKKSDEPEWRSDLEQAFLSSFLNHHPEYHREHCLAVSGSARTALSILGFHCGIQEVIVLDLSWTYEHCFPSVDSVPLTESLSLDSKDIIQKVEDKLRVNASWSNHGAVILNNPHNASGQIFEEEEMTILLKWLLERGIFIIDDLSYENVAPSNSLDGPRTLKQIANQLVKSGRLRQDQTRSLISIHSLSKTDCFAGARLSVVEIRDRELLMKFQEVLSTVSANLMAMLLAYLFYRHDADTVRDYWTLRNQIFEERMQALENAQQDLPAERNPFNIQIKRPKGGMYPQLLIQDLPSGISLDWLSSNLAKRGIGLVPLTTFARLERGFDLGRKTFRLTLGGTDGAEVLSRKMRRVLIDLNRIIADESTGYIRKSMEIRPRSKHRLEHFIGAEKEWDRVSNKVRSLISEKAVHRELLHLGLERDKQAITGQFFSSFLPERMKVFDQRFRERFEMAELVASEAHSALKPEILHTLERELYKEDLDERCRKFRNRLSDRTVHPTQMFSLKVDTAVNRMIEEILWKQTASSNSIKQLSEDLVAEHLGLNIPIRSHEEGEELLADMQAMLDAEEMAFWNCQTTLPTLLSFWGDWDGSTRPSGQGHRLVAAALVENVKHLSKFLKVLMDVAGPIDIDADLLQDIRQLDKKSLDFWNLLNQITTLTNHLEQRYLKVLPFNVRPGAWRRFGMRLHIARDPVDVLWQHNDRLEAKMLKLRMKRKQNLEYYFSLNKRLRKALYKHLDLISENLHHLDLALAAGRYRSILKRFVLTPRIHQKMVLSLDKFAIDTTVHNMMEINEIAGIYGNPGMVLALQVSFSTDPEAFISLERKLRSEREEILRGNSDADLPAIWVVPLFEDLETVKNLGAYLDRLWEYAVQSRRLDQTPPERFSEMVCEIFVAGSDLSQQVSQQAATVLYKQVKQTAIRWLAEKSLVGKVRIKLGSGEPMQRQGGYYDHHSGRPAVILSKEADKRLSENLKASTKRSTKYAISPLRGILAGGEFRTFQSNLSEKLRALPSQERAQIIYHVSESQRYYEGELIRAAEPLEETRLSFEEKGLQELEMLTRGIRDDLYNEFVETVTRYFRQILYGRDEDVVGIHVISYFVSRSLPTLRDRPVVRPSREAEGKYEQQVVERLAQTLPLAKYGSLLRAIGHNRAQTMILGINQLSTGLFRALGEYSERMPDRILPYLSVQDILHTVRIYHEPGLQYIRQLETAFPAGNSAFLTLREDVDSFSDFISLLQKEFVRRQGLDVSEFFMDDKIIGQLLPTLRPDIAVLLQPDLFNTDIENFFSYIGEKIESPWTQAIKELLDLPVKVRHWRKEIWQLIRLPISQQVKSFVELALAIDKLSTGKRRKESLLVKESAEIEKMGIKIVDLLRGAVDDPMRQFLTSAVQYLVQVPEQMEKVPIEVIRALRDVEQIVRIEKQVIGEKEQDLLRFYIMQMARICGENG